MRSLRLWGLVLVNLALTASFTTDKAEAQVEELCGACYSGYVMGLPATAIPSGKG